MTEDTVQATDQTSQQLQQIVEAAFEEAPAIYANGFLNGIGLVDSYLILQANGRSMAVVNMSLSVAKTMAQSLTAMIENYEQQTGNMVATLDEVQDRANR